jgi:hypothetical protein
MSKNKATNNEYFAISHFVPNEPSYHHKRNSSQIYNNYECSAGQTKSYYT